MGLQDWSVRAVKHIAVGLGCVLYVRNGAITEMTHPIEGRHFIFLFFYFFSAAIYKLAMYR